MLELVHDPALSKDVLAAGSAVTRAVIADASPAPAAHAHMTVLMALLLEDEPEEALRVYTRECSVGVSAKDLGMMGATLANGGMNPLTRKQVMPL